MLTAVSKCVHVVGILFQTNTMVSSTIDDLDSTIDNLSSTIENLGSTYEKLG